MCVCVRAYACVCVHILKLWPLRSPPLDEFYKKNKSYDNNNNHFCANILVIYKDNQKKMSAFLNYITLKISTSEMNLKKDLNLWKTIL